MSSCEGPLGGLRGEHAAMMKETKMEILRVLIHQCLSAAAEEILRIAERTIVEYEEEVSSSPSALEVKSHDPDSAQTCFPEVKPSLPAADSCWGDPERSTSGSPAAGRHAGVDDREGLKQEPDVTPKKPFKCPVCAAAFSSKKAMMRHFRRHPEEEGPSSYRCQLCQLLFHHRADFIVHRRVHGGSPPLQDQVYEDSVEPGKSQETLALTPPGTLEGERGLRIKTELEQEALQPLCLFQVQAEVIDSSVQVPFIKSESSAEEGAAAAEVEAKLPRASAPPLKVQAGPSRKPYKCPCCSKCFSLTKTLIRHVKIHADDTPYRCHFCGRNFCQKSDLVNHTRIHTGEKPYRCHRCHKSFAQKGNLGVHMRRHCTKTPY